MFTLYHECVKEKKCRTLEQMNDEILNIEQGISNIERKGIDVRHQSLHTRWIFFKIDVLSCL